MARTANSRSSSGVARSKAAARDVADRTAQEFLIEARERLLELERDAEAAANELDETLVQAVERLYDYDAVEARRFEAFGEILIEHQRAVAERSAHLRRRLERRGHLASPPSRLERRAGDIVAEPAEPRRELAPRTNGSGPSEGVVLLARQMAATGADDRRIARTLSVLGVDHADEAVRESLH